MKMYFRCAMPAGEFRIEAWQSRWRVWFEDEMLGTYATPQMALDDLAGGHTFWPSCGDPSRFGLPSEIGDWELVSPAKA